MTDKPGGFLNELRQIEEALGLVGCNVFPSHVKGCGGCSSCRKKAEALSSLRSLFAGDAGEDEKKLHRVIDYAELTLDEFDEAKAALLYLSAKAKLGLAEIREAKRKVLNKTLMAISYFDPETDDGVKLKLAIYEVFDEQLAALDKEAGK